MTDRDSGRMADDVVALAAAPSLDAAPAPTAAEPGVPPGRATRESFDRDLRTIKDDVLVMGTYVEEQVRAAIDALVRHDAEAALAVIAADGRVNDAQGQVSALITAVIATQQPVARDLRLLLTLDHVSYELERMGDYAASVAKQARKLAPEAPLGGNVDLPEMGERAAHMISAVLRALVEIDVEAAREAAVEDDEIDRLYHRTFSETLRLMQADPANVDRGARILFAAHYIERMGDRATNIAEDVVFLGSGEIVDLN